MPIGLLYGLGAALMWGLTDVAATFAGRRLGSLRVVVASQAVGLAVLVAIALATGVTLPTEPGVVAIAILVGFAGTGAYLAFFTALRIGPLSVVSPITAAYGGLTVVLAVLLQNESLSTAQALGATVATVGVVLAGIEFGGGGRPRVVGRGVAFALVALVLFALMTVGSAGPIREVGWLPAMLVSRMTNVATSTILLVLALRSASPRVDALLEGSLPRNGRAWGIAGAAGLLDVVGLVSFGIGLELAPTWEVGLASSFGPAIAVLVAVTFLRERPRPTQWLGLLAIAVGIGLVATG
jgi:drug/metabolite transporter (DMT)-like permease